MLDNKIWGPYYWFVLFTIGITYPINPNEISKKNIMNLFKIYLYLCQILR